VLKKSDAYREPRHCPLLPAKHKKLRRHWSAPKNSMPCTQTMR